MCGIFGYIGNKKTASDIVLDGLKSLEYRGYDSWGIAVISDANKIALKKKTGKIGSATVDELPPSTISFGHTRWATHGGVTNINAHPHLDCNKQIALVHNGIIENYESLKKDLLSKNHTFISDTDTEVAVHLIEEYQKNMSLIESVQKAFNQFEGLNAIIVTDLESKQIIAVRNGSPLVVGFGTGENFLASDASALLPHTREVHFLEDYEMAILTKENIKIQNVKTGTTIHPKKVHLDWTAQQADLGTFPHFMLKEMHEQPHIIADIANQNAQDAVKLAELISTSFGSYLLGCGSASYVAIAGSYLFSKIANKHMNWAIGSEFGYQLDFLTDKSLVIALSQSGETMDILESIKKAKAKGARIFALTNVLGSTLYREAHHKLLIGAGPEKAVASTKAVTGKLAHLILLAYALAGEVAKGQHVLAQAVSSVNAVLAKKNVESIKLLAKMLKQATDVYVIGRGLSFPASLETAIKIKEISYIHAEGMPAGELKHGPLALVEKEVPCIVFAPDDETHGANLAGAMEMKARGGFIIGISHIPHEVFDYYLPVEDAKEATIIPNIVTGQLLSYYLTVERGLDPDKPRNLAKSVTVK